MAGTDTTGNIKDAGYTPGQKVVHPAFFIKNCIVICALYTFINSIICQPKEHDNCPLKTAP